MGRGRQFSSNAEKQRAYRDRLVLRNGSEALRNIASTQLVLSLFPGADLFGRAF